MHFLFVKHELCFPRVSGHDVHCYGMMRALAEAGHQISLLTVEPCSEESCAGIDLESRRSFVDQQSCDLDSFGLPYLQRKFCSYWGVPPQRLREVATVAGELEADVVVGVGLDVLPYLATVRNAQRVWYAADEWVIHHLSQVFLTDPASWDNLKLAAVKGLYERAFSPCIDRVWLVSERDARAIRRVMPHSETDVVPNGVDVEHFRPQSIPEIDRSCVFWGRLDFGPNLDAIRWFAANVWKRVNHNATFTVYGFKPGKAVEDLAVRYGFEVIPDLPDIRAEICRRQVVVLPFVSGAGIKNKLLEAASLGRSIVASDTALNGIDLCQANVMRTASSPSQWTRVLEELWQDDEERQALGDRARQWVSREYTWESAAGRVVESLRNAN